MTEKIKELAKQCQNNDGTVEYETFAKLIIEECISACATDSLGKTVGAEELIKERFGL